jgi:hypothetical protein
MKAKESRSTLSNGAPSARTSVRRPRTEGEMARRVVEEYARELAKIKLMSVLEQVCMPLCISRHQ